MPIIFIDRSAPDSNDLAGLPDTSHCRGSTSEAANGGLSDRLSHIGRRAVGDHGRVDSVGPGFRVRNAGELVVGLTPRSDAHDALGSKRHFAKTSVRPRMFALDVAVDAPRIRSIAKLARKKFVQQYIHGTRGHDKVVGERQLDQVVPFPFRRALRNARSVDMNRASIGATSFAGSISCPFWQARSSA